MKIGDFVSRDGTDVHLLCWVNYAGDLGGFLCVVPPDSGWTSLGDMEANLMRRYEPLDPAEVVRHLSAFHDPSIVSAKRMPMQFTNEGKAPSGGEYWWAKRIDDGSITIIETEGAEGGLEFGSDTPFEWRDRYILGDQLALPCICDDTVRDPKCPKHASWFGVV